MLPHKTRFVRLHIKLYWYFRRVTTKQYYTHISEFRDMFVSKMIIKEACMFTFDGIVAQLTSKLTESNNVKENLNLQRLLLAISNVHSKEFWNLVDTSTFSWIACNGWMGALRVLLASYIIMCKYHSSSLKIMRLCSGFM